MKRYESVRRVTDNGQTRIGTATLPKAKFKDSDLLMTTVDGDRCDTISQLVYKTPTLWWYIASINNLKSNNIPPGTQLRVPVEPSNAVLK